MTAQNVFSKVNTQGFDPILSSCFKVCSFYLEGKLLETPMSYFPREEVGRTYFRPFNLFRVQVLIF